MKHLMIHLLVLGSPLTTYGSCLPYAVNHPGCDTLTTLEGKTYICHIQQQTKEETQFSLCDDPEGKVFAIPNNRISNIAHVKVDMKQEEVANSTTSISKPKAGDSKHHEKKLPKQKRKKSEEELASGLLWQGIISLVLTASIFLIPAGFFIGLFAVNDAKKLLRATKGNPKFKKIRRKLRWAILLGSISMLLSIGILVGLIHLLSNLQDIGDFSFGSWDWSNG